MAMANEGEKYLSVIDRIISEAEKEGTFVTANDVAAALFRLAFIELEEKDYERMDFDDEEFQYSKLDMVRLFINAGRLDGLKEAHIVKGIASRTTLSGKMIGSIEMHKNFSFVDVPRPYVEEVMEAMVGFAHGGRGISFEVAEKKKRGGSKGNTAKRKEKRKAPDKHSDRKGARKENKPEAEGDFSGGYVVKRAEEGSKSGSGRKGGRFAEGSGRRDSRKGGRRDSRKDHKGSRRKGRR